MNKKEIQQFLQDFIQSWRVEINNLYNALSLDEALELNKKKRWYLFCCRSWKW